MSFTELPFCLIFLPAALIAYYACRGKLRDFVLVCLSVFYYYCAGRNFLLLFVILVAGNIFLSIIIGLIKKKSSLCAKLILGIGILLNIATLSVFKYSKNILFPLGVSFTIFKAVSYLVDTYQEKHNFKNVLQGMNYLAFFGQVQSGPISRVNSFEKRACSWENFSDGCVRFMIGFSKKILLANSLNNITSEIWTTGNMSSFMAWMGALCYSLELYYDFSGYSDMAIGISSMFGYSCPENFKYPYMTQSVAEFWRRWHVTLGAWFRDYVYIPLGGSRVHIYRVISNLFVVWILTGIWHGAGWNFIAWGVGYFLWITFEKVTGLPKKIKNGFGKIIYRVIILTFIAVQWVMFRSTNIHSGLQYIRTMFLYNANALSTDRMFFLMKDYAIVLIAALIFTVPIMPWLESKANATKLSQNMYQIISGIFIAGIFTIAFAFSANGQTNPFAYANF